MSIPASGTISQGVDVTGAALVLPFVDTAKTKHLVTFAGDSKILFIGDASIVLDYVTIGLSIPIGSTVFFRFVSSSGASLDYPAYISANGQIRRVLSGAEMPTAGIYRVIPLVSSARFSGKLDMFFLYATGDKP